MSNYEPKHIINRYTFEVEVGEKRRAHNIQNQLSQIFNYNLKKILDKVMTELSDPGMVYRIKKLELDLGEFEESQLDVEMPRRLEKELRKKLRDLIAFKRLEIDVAGPTAEILSIGKSKLEILAYFLETGNASIWTKLEGFSPEQFFRQVLEEEPEKLAKTLTRVGRSLVAIRRISYQFSQSTVDQVFKVLVPTHSMFLSEYAVQMQRTLRSIPGLNFSVGDLRHHINESILFYLLREKSLVFDKDAFIKSFKRQILERLEIAPEDLTPSQKANNSFPEIKQESLADKLAIVVETFITLNEHQLEIPKEEKEARQRVLLLLLEKYPEKIFLQLKQKGLDDWPKIFEKLEKALPRKHKGLIPKFVAVVSQELRREERDIKIQTEGLEQLLVLLQEASPQAPKEEANRLVFEETTTILLTKYPRKLVKKLERKVKGQWEVIINKLIKLLPKSAQKPIIHFVKILVETQKITKDSLQLLDVKKIADKAIQQRILVFLAEVSTQTTFPEIRPYEQHEAHPEPKVVVPGEEQGNLNEQETPLDDPLIETRRDRPLGEAEKDSKAQNELNQGEEGQPKDGEAPSEADKARDEEWLRSTQQSKQEQSPYYKLVQQRKAKAKTTAAKAEKEAPDFREAEPPALLDFVAYYLANDKAPWWAKGVNYQSFDQIFVQLSAENPTALKQILTAIRDKGSAEKKRLLLSIFTKKVKPVSQQKMVELLEKDMAGFIVSTVLLLEKMDDQQLPEPIKGKLDPAIVPQLKSIKAAAWELALHYIIAKENGGFDLNEFIGHIIAKIAQQSNVSNQAVKNTLSLIAEVAAEKEKRFTPFKTILMTITGTTPAVEIQDSQAASDLVDQKATPLKTKDTTDERKTQSESPEGQLPKTEKGQAKQSQPDKDRQPDKTEQPDKTKEAETTAPTKQEKTGLPKEKQADLPLQAQKFVGSDYELLAYFLEYGSLPSHAAMAPASFEQEVLGYIKRNDYEIVELLRHYLKSPKIRQRVVKQFSKTLQAEVTKLLLVQSAKVLEEQAQLVKVAQKTASTDILAAVEEHMLYFAVHQKTAYFRSYSYFKSLIKYAVREQQVSTKVFLTEFSKAIPAAKVSPKMKKLVEVLEKEFESKPQKDFPKEPKERTVWEMKTRKPKQNEPIFIKNAGLVITWPLLPFFFKTLGLLTPLRKFKDEKAAYRGVHLLQYLATGHQAESEHLLPLNKLMCGVPFGAPVELDVVLTEEEKSLCEALLKQICKQWPAMKNSSPNGVRGSFLIREGKITLVKENVWTVKADPKGFDMLLASLPWSLDMFTLPWTENRFNVEWRNEQTL